MRGGEKVVEVLSDLYPHADIFTLVCDPNAISDKLKRHRITTSFLQKIGGVKHYQKMLALMPYALESFDLTGYDLIVSSESGPARASSPARTRPTSATAIRRCATSGTCIPSTVRRPARSRAP